jgi:hypothetical protein
MPYTTPRWLALASLLNTACATPASQSKGATSDAKPEPKPAEAPRPPPARLGWTTEDAQTLVDGMLAQCIRKAPWIDDFAGKHKRMPTVRSARMVNKTTDHISREQVLGPLEKAMADTHAVEVLPAIDSVAQQAAREEQARAASGASDSDVKIGEEKAADYVLALSLTSTVDFGASSIIQTYSTTLRIVDSTTGAIACMAIAKSTRAVPQPPTTP